MRGTSQVLSIPVCHGRCAAGREDHHAIPRGTPRASLCAGRSTGHQFVAAPLSGSR